MIQYPISYKECSIFDKSTIIQVLQVARELYITLFRLNLDLVNKQKNAAMLLDNMTALYLYTPSFRMVLLLISTGRANEPVLHRHRYYG